MTERVTKYRATSKIKLRDQWTFRTFQDKRQILSKKKKQLTYLLCRSVVCLVNMSPYPISLSTRETDIYVIVPDLRHVVSQQQPLFVDIAWRRALHQIICASRAVWGKTIKLPPLFPLVVSESFRNQPSHECHNVKLFIYFYFSAFLVQRHSYRYIVEYQNM